MVGTHGLLWQPVLVYLQLVNVDPVKAPLLPSCPDPREQMTATETLYRRGAHFVLTGALNDPKRPLWRKWQSPRYGRPTLDVVTAHLALGRPLGLIPWSLRETVIDIDAGDPDAWVHDNPPRLAVPSRRPAGRHCYYDDDRPQPRRTFALGGLAGEYIGARAFVVLCMTPPTDLPQRSSAPGVSRSPATCSRRPASSRCWRSRSAAT